MPADHLETMINGNSRREGSERSSQVSELQPFEEQHFAVAYWARRWGFSEKTVREWFRDEPGPGILRQSNVGRRKKRDYTTIMISPSAAARVYAKRTSKELIH
jgi:hypothetical protein